MTKEALKLALEALERYQVKRQDFERFADVITAIKEALAQPEQEPVTPFGLPLFWDAPAPRPDGSLINEGTKKPSYATAWLSGHAQGLEDGMAMKREQKLLTDNDFADILEDEIEKQGGGGVGFNVDQLMKAVEKVCRERYTTPPQRKPLTDEQIVETFCKAPHQTQYVAWFAAGVRYAEAAHGIKE